MRKTTFVIFVVFVAIVTCGMAGNLEAGPQLEIAEDSVDPGPSRDNSRLREIRTLDNSRAREIGRC